jgi:hypothetical protein
MPIAKPNRRTLDPAAKLSGKGGNAGSKSMRSKKLPMKNVRMGAATKMNEYAATVPQLR